jgi:CBS domain containing-hemolysin-like protein
VSTDAVPLRKIPLNKVPFVPNNEPLLGILDKFQEGRSHMAIVSRFSVDKVGVVLFCMGVVRVLDNLRIGAPYEWQLTIFWIGGEC